jgi:hypothetical protein
LGFDLQVVKIIAYFFSFQIIAPIKDVDQLSTSVLVTDPAYNLGDEGAAAEETTAYKLGVNY